MEMGDGDPSLPLGMTGLFVVTGEEVEARPGEPPPLPLH